MLPPVTPETIQKITDKIVQEFHPEKIILFGSHAWGSPGPDSDVDLFIVKESTKRRIDRAFELRKKLIGNRFPPMDILIYTPAELSNRLNIGDLFIRDILENGKTLYDGHKILKTRTAGR